MDREERSALLALLIGGLIGALLGFGTDGSIQAAAEGCGLGALAALILFGGGTSTRPTGD